MTAAAEPSARELRNEQLNERLNERRNTLATPRHAKRFPFPLPNGWFQVAYSDELAVDAVLPLHYFKRDLIAFRDETIHRAKLVVTDELLAQAAASAGAGET